MKPKKPRRRITRALLAEWGLKWLAEYGYELVGYADLSHDGWNTRWHDTAQDRISEVMIRHELVILTPNMWSYKLNEDKLKEVLNGVS
jgi:hypothetical protein